MFKDAGLNPGLVLVLVQVQVCCSRQVSVMSFAVSTVTSCQQLVMLFQFVSVFFGFFADESDIINT